LQPVFPTGHRSTHVESTHAASPPTGIGHAREQLPQRSGSDVVSTQVPPHEVLPPVQAHSPPTHLESVSHALPHMPQFAGSLVGFTHLSPQRSSDAAHPESETDVSIFESPAESFPESTGRDASNESGALDVAHEARRPKTRTSAAFICDAA
jgi:hypothetical protein